MHNSQGIYMKLLTLAELKMNIYQNFMILLESRLYMIINMEH
jgi:hypothetical protein